MSVRRMLTAVVGVMVLLGGLLLAAGPAKAASLQEVTNFGTNPSQLRMYLYVPDGVGARPAIVVGVHWCHGDGLAFYNGSGLAAQADRYKFIVIFPSVTQASDGCFDVHSTASLTHNGGSDSLGIVSMVKYVEQHDNGDPGRVFATGLSSGAMMTNVLLGAYPDVFKAGSAFAGVPFGCFAGSDTWSTSCATGQITKTAQQWGDLVRAAYPGYSGPRPTMQLWHGTADQTLNYHNFGEEIKQWTNVLGVSATPLSTEQNTPQSGFTRTRYGSSAGNVVVEAVSEAGVTHNLTYLAAQVVHWFGLDSTTTTTTTTATRTTGTTSTTTTTRTTSTTVATSTTTRTTGATGSCSIAYKVTSSWNGGFVADVTIRPGSAVNGWTVTWTYGGGQLVTSAWNGTATQSGGTVTVKDAGYNASIAAGGTATFGLQGTGSSAAPGGFTLNGSACSAG